jgi:hypothetical protein
VFATDFIQFFAINFITASFTEFIIHWACESTCGYSTCDMGNSCKIDLLFINEIHLWTSIFSSIMIIVNFQFQDFTFSNIMIVMFIIIIEIITSTNLFDTTQVLEKLNDTFHSLCRNNKKITIYKTKSKRFWKTWILHVMNKCTICFC